MVGVRNIKLNYLKKSQQQSLKGRRRATTNKRQELDRSDEENDWNQWNKVILNLK